MCRSIIIYRVFSIRVIQVHLESLVNLERMVKLLVLNVCIIVFETVFLKGTPGNPGLSGAAGQDVRIVGVHRYEKYLILNRE